VFASPPPLPEPPSPHVRHDPLLPPLLLPLLLAPPLPLPELPKWLSPLPPQPELEANAMSAPMPATPTKRDHLPFMEPIVNRRHASNKRYLPLVTAWADRPQAAERRPV
jgi:hypothetical protein